MIIFYPFDINLTFRLSAIPLRLSLAMYVYNWRLSLGPLRLSGRNSLGAFSSLGPMKKTTGLIFFIAMLIPWREVRYMQKG